MGFPSSFRGMQTLQEKIDSMCFVIELPIRTNRRESGDEFRFRAFVLEKRREVGDEFHYQFKCIYTVKD